MRLQKLLRAILCLGVVSTMLVGCAAKPSKAEVEKRVRESLAAASPEWKDITYETKADDTISVVTANRAVDGKTYGFVFTGGGRTGGVATRTPLGVWLAKYRYEKDKEVNAEKMEGTDDDVKLFRALAAEFAAAAIKVCP